MQPLDLQVIRQTLAWLNSGETVWLCTVIGTFGSSPRPPGAMLVARSNGACCGSLSGGCIEDDFLERVAAGRFPEPLTLMRYGDGTDAPQVRLPCGGIMDVLVERLEALPVNVAHVQQLEQALLGHARLIRQWSLPMPPPSCSKTSNRALRCSATLIACGYGSAPRSAWSSQASPAWRCFVRNSLWRWISR